jgi:hypothetical protein
MESTEEILRALNNLKVTISGQVDVSDRASRLLGIVYGSQNQQLQQRATTYELLTTIRQSGSELSASNPIFDSIIYGGAVIDPRSIRALVASDIISALQDGVVDANNSTTTPLLANGVFTGTKTPILPYGVIQVMINSDQKSATNGLSFQFSSDGVNWEDNEVTTFVDTTIGQGYALAAKGSYFRVVYTNGGTNQTYFRLQTIQRFMQQPGDTLDASDEPQANFHALLTKSIISGKSLTGAYYDCLVNSTGQLAVIAYGSVNSALLQDASSNDLIVQLATGTTEYDARQIRALTASDIVTSLINYPSGTLIDPRSIRALTASDIVTALINYPSGTLIDPRSIRALTSADVVTVDGSAGQNLQQRATTYELLVQLATAGTQYDARQIRALTASDIVTIADINPYIANANQYSGNISSATTTTVISANSTQSIKVYDFSIWNDGTVACTVTLQFGTSGKIIWKGTLQASSTINVGVISNKTRPWQSNTNDSLQIVTSASSSIDYSIGAVQS